LELWSNVVNKPYRAGDFKPVLATHPLPSCDDRLLAGEVKTYDVVNGLYGAVAFISGARIRLGIYCSRAAACAAIADAHWLDCDA
jgi:hypothetical protein